MADYRTMYDATYLGAWDLQGRDITVQIAKVVPGKLGHTGGPRSKKPIVYFERAEKALPLNKTNGLIVAALYGTDAAKWVGQRITLYPTTTQFGGATVDCIRVRPTKPGARVAAERIVSQPVDEAMRDAQERAARAVDEPGASDADENGGSDADA